METCFEAKGRDAWSALGIFRGLNRRVGRSILRYVESGLEGAEIPSSARTLPVIRIPRQSDLSSSRRDVTGL
jgi:hypothetical protein